MPLKKAFLLAASIVLADPAWAFDAAQTVFYVSIPLDRHESRLSYGLRLQAERRQASAPAPQPCPQTCD